MTRPMNPDDHFPRAWVPPQHWEFGICQDCGKQFKPRLPKQYFCEPCRAYSMKNTNWQSPFPKSKGAITRMCKFRRKKSIPAVCRALGFKTTTIYQWDKGAVPSDYRQAEQLRAFLNCRMDQLFSDSVIEKMEKNQRWRT